MFQCEELSVRAADGTAILNGASAQFQPGALNAIIGPSGCGKTTLVKALLGIVPATGKIRFGEQSIEPGQLPQGLVGFAPQFSIAQPKLTVEESIRYTLELFVGDAQERPRRLESILETVGLAEHRQKRVEALSGGQLRRLGLGLELTLDPACMVCDEVTSGLDPHSEDQILALLRQLCDARGKTFLCIIHNLAKLDQFDHITVVHQGRVLFQGSPDALCEHFGISDALHLYDILEADAKKADAPGASRERPHRECSAEPAALPASREEPAQPAIPGMFWQFYTLLRRRFVLFIRDRGYLLLTLAITLGFPCMVVIFAWDGLPQIEGLALERDGGIIEELRENLAFQAEQMQTAQLVTGLIMFQVILLTLMGANNGAREIAGERALFEKERFSGLKVGAYTASKVVFVLAIALLQGAWMTFFVKTICQFPGPWLPQILALASVCGAMTLVSLGFSALFNSADKASLLSIYLVGFQLPLSGVVLALPDALVWVCRPFITAYWGWAGYLASMRETRIFDAFRMHNTEWVASPELAVAVLSLQGLAGLGLVVYGCSRRAQP